ncbi:protein WVD2-like 7 isoform X1 [Solanum pennellii]|uniref:Protein WVD2-like 7 isoform X1 n=1 Tax=Solanum pennellii TaxID=28526 RepID=A0ABM1V492_SOLPN|nr:protein WVD2-like 7 isoform X1 [Solanum pennellii]XP_027770560.1 protein WVD2-like 7 isoform X1 [Solanum pennellii]XP_027770561.1 protein WVD2-like 7 isoform X1 [Solanum pennellii]XP_027770563.1 protein WVD2-like 7 isoform X1 [Solanum pennellii]
MGDSSCLMHAFSYASALPPNEAKQGNHMHALGESISFGRFTMESLAWDKWSAFPHKRYVEEAERYAQPGSVAQKKAFFEAHYKKVAAQKAAALLEQENTQQDTLAVDPNVNSSMEGVADVKEKENAAPLARVGSLKQPQETFSGSELSETSYTEKPLLKQSSSSKQDDDVTSATSKKKTALSSFKSSVYSIKSKIPPSPARHNISGLVNEENNFTPITKNPKSAFANEKKSTSKSLSRLMNFTPAKETDKVPPPPPPTFKKESSKLVPNAAKKCITPLKTPAETSDGAVKHPMTTPSSENRRMETPIHPSASGSQTTGPKWNILSSVCSKSLTACRNKLQSPSLSTPFLLRTEERAARRKQKLEEKFNAKEVQKVQLQTKIKEKAEMELRKLRQSFCFRARPLPKFYKERETARNHTKKTPVKRPQSPKLGRNPSNSTMQDLASHPTSTYSAKSSSYKYSGKKNCPKPINSHTLSTVMSRDQNASPNIQHQFGVSPN